MNPIKKLISFQPERNTTDDKPLLLSSPYESDDNTPKKSSIRRKKRTEIPSRNNAVKKRKLYFSQSSSSSEDDFNHISKPSSLHFRAQDKKLITPVAVDQQDQKESISNADETPRNNIILKYFQSLSKQIGQLNSQLAQNSSDLKELSFEIRDMKKNFRKQFFCHDSDNDTGSDNARDINDGEGIKDKTKEILQKFQFPIESKETFENFNQQLDTDHHYRNQLTKRIHQLINNNIMLKKNMTRVIKSYVARGLALLYVPSQPSLKDSSKAVFKDTSFYKCIEVAMRKKLSSASGNELSNKELLDAMTATIRNARDWDGYRLLRINKIQPY